MPPLLLKSLIDKYETLVLTLLDFCVIFWWSFSPFEPIHATLNLQDINQCVHGLSSTTVFFAYPLKQAALLRKHLEDKYRAFKSSV